MSKQNAVLPAVNKQNRWSETNGNREEVNAAIDKKTLKRIQYIQQLDNDTKDNLCFLIDNVVQTVKAKKTRLLTKKAAQ